jgi:lipopolysaccharide/colanic/teichoic acid biosynthesis glycosyltransferase
VSQLVISDSTPVRKRVFDLTFAAVLLVLASPLLVTIAVVIKLVGGRGPVLFRGSRVGRFGVPFDILKFRTMRLGSEAAAQLTAGGDTRVTAVGSVLRATKIDELPQLWNVIRGDMSMVGPRPEAPVYVAFFNERQRATLSVRPGITGAAALEYRNEEAVLARIPASERDSFYVNELLPQELESELEYLANWSLGRDVLLIVRTAIAAVTGLGLSRNTTTRRIDWSSEDRRRPVTRSALPLLAVDLSMWACGMVVASVLRHGHASGVRGEHLVLGTVMVCVFQGLLGLWVGLYRGRYSVGRFEEAGAVVVVQALVVAVFFLTYSVVRHVPVGRGTAVAAAYWALLPMLGARYGWRYWQSRRLPPPAPFSRRALVYGAGFGAHQILPALRFNPDSRYRPVGLIDDDPNKRYRRLVGVPVVGTRDTISDAAERYRADVLIIAVPSASDDFVQELVVLGRAAGLDVIMLRPASELLVSATDPTSREEVPQLL